MRVQYETWKPRSDAKAIISEANAICRDYAAQGYDLTLRQLYYQFVARGFLPNNQESYNKLGNVVNRARLAGLLDWDYIVDRTRNLEALSHWSTPADIVAACARSYHIDLWEAQPVRVEVWIEKEALAGVIERIANRYDCAWFACRGYVSQSEMWHAAQRIGGYIDGRQRVLILHLGDHDPSGIDMTRDIAKRIDNFAVQDFYTRHPDLFPGESAYYSAIREAMWNHVDPNNTVARYHPSPIEIRRIALTMDQVEEYNPPPNPAKLTDSRANDYIFEYGNESWELDALEPTVLSDLIEEHVTAEIEDDAWNVAIARMNEEKEVLTKTSQEWPRVVSFINNGAKK